MATESTSNNEKNQEDDTVLLEDTENEAKYDILNEKGYPLMTKRLEPIARILLLAVYDDNHPFSAFRGMRYIVKAIWEYVLQFNKHYWYKHIKVPLESESTHYHYAHSIGSSIFPYRSWKFPDININMMPFIMADTFTDTKLPRYLEKYYDTLIMACLNKDHTQLNKICYLTIQESFVEKGKTQRRPGLHVETPGIIYIPQQENDNGAVDKVRYKKGFGMFETGRQQLGWWGLGTFYEKPYGGIYMASNVADSCAVWDCGLSVVSVENEDGGVSREIIGHLGDIEHLRDSLPDDQRMVMKANEIYWICDRTPHESLPMKESGYRQFFRLVTSDVNIWYEEHSTPNPNGVKPDETKVTIIKGNKFIMQFRGNDIDDVGNGADGKCNGCVLL